MLRYAESFQKTVISVYTRLFHLITILYTFIISMSSENIDASPCFGDFFLIFYMCYVIIEKSLFCGETTVSFQERKMENDNAKFCADENISALTESEKRRDDPAGNQFMREDANGNIPSTDSPETKPNDGKKTEILKQTSSDRVLSTIGENGLENADADLRANTVQDDEHTVHIKTKNKVLRRNFDYYPVGIKRFFFRIAWWFVIPLLVLYDWIFLGLRFMDKKNASCFRFGKHKKLITVSNHLHIMDCSMVAHIFYPRKIYFTSIQSNFGIPVAGGLVRLLGGVPIPDDKENMRKFTDDMEKMMRANRIVQYYPESALHPYQANIRNFKKGAFQFAVQSQAPVLPIVFIMRKPRGLYRLYKRRPLFTGVIGKPLYPNSELEGREAVVELMNRVHDEMTELQKRGLKRLGEKRAAKVYRSMDLFENK